MAASSLSLSLLRPFLSSILFFVFSSLGFFNSQSRNNDGLPFIHGAVFGHRPKGSRDGTKGRTHQGRQQHAISLGTRSTSSSLNEPEAASVQSRPIVGRWGLTAAFRQRGGVELDSPKGCTRADHGAQTRTRGLLGCCYCRLVGAGDQHGSGHCWLDWSDWLGRRDLNRVSRPRSRPRFHGIVAGRNRIRLN